MKRLKTQITLLETYVKRNEEKTNDCFKQLNEKQKQHSETIVKVVKDIDDIQKFAEHISELHYNLGNEIYRRNHINHFDTLFQDACTRKMLKLKDGTK